MRERLEVLEPKYGHVRTSDSGVSAWMSSIFGTKKESSEIQQCKSAGVSVNIPFTIIGRILTCRETSETETTGDPYNILKKVNAALEKKQSNIRIGSIVPVSTCQEWEKNLTLKFGLRHTNLILSGVAKWTLAPEITFTFKEDSVRGLAIEISKIWFDAFTSGYRKYMGDKWPYRFYLEDLIGVNDVQLDTVYTAVAQYLTDIIDYTTRLVKSDEEPLDKEAANEMTEEMTDEEAKKLENLKKFVSGAAILSS